MTTTMLGRLSAASTRLPRRVVAASSHRGGGSSSSLSRIGLARTGPSVRWLCPSSVWVGGNDTILSNVSSVRGFHASPVTKNDGDYPPHTLFPMPALSPTMESGSIAEWKVEEGQSFAAGDVLCEVETDKATVDFEAQDDGVLAKILVPASGTNEIAVGAPICVVVEDEADVSAFASFELPAEAEAVPPPVAAAAEPTISAPAPPASSGPVTTPLGEFVLTPSARHRSVSAGVDASVLYPGSGKDGRVTKGDFLQAVAAGTYMPALAKEAPSPPADAVVVAPAATAAPTAMATPPPPVVVVTPIPDADIPFEDVTNNKMRKIIASRLTESKANVPHFYTTASVPLDDILQMRKRMAKDFDIKFSVNDAIIRSSALALRDVPEMNAVFSAQASSGFGELSPTVDISVAVATPTGLITPIVTEADRRGLVEISSVVRDLATRAREGSLAPEEYQGGSFTISNLGMFGISEFSAVINPPQAAILAVGGGVPTIVPSGNGGSPKIKTVMEARLSADRRVVDEAVAGLFLQALKSYLSRPELLLL